jgi:flagellar hook-basal body complex protein FliE
MVEVNAHPWYPYCCGGAKNDHIKMILEENEALTRLGHPDNLVNRLKSNVEVIQEVNHGRSEGAKGIPPRVRELLGIIKNGSNDTCQEIAGTFGVGITTISNASRGLRGDGSFDEELAEVVEKSTKDKEKEAHELALDALVGSITKVNDTIHTVEKPQIASKIANDMSKVINQLRGGRDGSANEVNVKVVLFAPPMRIEKDYETIEA